MKVTKIGGLGKSVYRVAAYCRVSTDKTEQEESFETQKNYYTKMIKSNPSWKLVKIYADEGKSGTSAKHRPQFMQMIEDAKHGDIDIILTKSISRFARNAMECQDYVKELKNHHVEVRFEKEGISSLDPSADFLFSVLALTAQEESHSISGNVRWKYRKNFEQGIYHMGNNRILGYDMGEDGKLVPNEDAWIVKKAFDDYASGMNLQQTAADLNNSGAHRLRSDKPFDSNIVKRMLTNETYVGDLHMQKNPPTDYLTKKPMKNIQYKTYLVKDEHEGIVSREVWDKVQENLDAVKAERENGYYRNGIQPHCLNGLVYCSQCGSLMVRKTYFTREKEKYNGWYCKGRFNKNGCTNPMIREKELLNELQNAMEEQGIQKEQGIQNPDDLEDAIVQNISRVDVGPEKINISFAGEKEKAG